MIKAMDEIYGWLDEDQIYRLSECIVSKCGQGLDWEAFCEEFLLLLEDVAGFENHRSRSCIETGYELYIKVACHDRKEKQ